MEPYWDLIKRIIKESDIVLEVLDARVVEYSRNSRIEELIKQYNKPRIFVINKIDLVSEHALEYSYEKLKQDGEVVYMSNKNITAVKSLLARIRQVFAKHGQTRIIESDIDHRTAKGEIIVGVVGYPNVGKSSVINGLAFKKKAVVSKKAGTTHGVHWIKVNDQIKMIDTPGVIPLEYTDEVRLGLIGAKDAQKLKEPDVVAARIIEMFMLKNKKAFEDFYGIKIESAETNPYEIIDEIALKKGHLKRGGKPDEMRTSTMIVFDWQHGKLGL